MLNNKRLPASVSSVAAFLLVHQFIWVFIISTVLYIAILLGYKTPLFWLAVAAVYLPFLFRLKLHGYISRRTTFDLPIALFLTSVIIGLIVSPDFAMSLGAFQGLLFLIAIYYSAVNHPNPAALVKFGLIFSTVLLVLTAVFYFLENKLHPQTYAFPRALSTLSGVAGGSIHTPIALWIAIITR